MRVENIELKLSDLNENNNQQQPQKPVEPEKQPPETTDDKNKDDNTAKGPLPQAGTTSCIIFFTILIVSALVSYRKYKKIKI